jgi:hypothetical protein
LSLANRSVSSSRSARSVAAGSSVRARSDGGDTLTCANAALQSANASAGCVRNVTACRSDTWQLPSTALAILLTY